MYEVESLILRARARLATAALISPLALRYAADGGVELEPGYTLEQAKNLCPDQAFADQPVLAWCSGVLIDDDLVATAGHCLGESIAVAERCRAADRARYLRGFRTSRLLGRRLPVKRHRTKGRALVRFTLPV